LSRKNDYRFISSSSSALDFSCPPVRQSTTPHAMLPRRIGHRLVSPVTGLGYSCIELPANDIQWRIGFELERNSSILLGKSMAFRDACSRCTSTVEGGRKIHLKQTIVWRVGRLEQACPTQARRGAHFPSGHGRIVTARADFALRRCRFRR